MYLNQQYRQEALQPNTSREIWTAGSGPRLFYSAIDVCQAAPNYFKMAEGTAMSVVSATFLTHANSSRNS